MRNKTELDKNLGLNKNTTLPLDDLSKPVKRTRHMHNNNYYITNYPCTNILKFSFVPRTVKDWNSLPRSAVEIVEDAKFRNYLLSMIL